MRDPILVREQFYLLAHDESRHMRPRLHVPALSAGLAGATVMDLMIAQRVTVETGTVHADRYARDSTGDPVSDDVLALIMDAQLAPSLPDLIRGAMPGLYERTTAALVHKGVIAEKSSTSRWRRAKEHDLSDPGIAVRVRAKVGYRIEQRDGPSPDADSLCALVAALGLHGALQRGSRAEIEPLLHQVIRDLPSNARRSHHPIGEAPVVAAAVLRVVQDLATAAL
ncbi:GPP34 family phosphoprotein [Actinoplanes sp. NPDC051851]|uniref:GOLPH3/VPS74 family protein n=1 Tax=Actinoplanes sp. NPDC051851 TaxID=3154753 RepID=UPI003432C545